jgi:hypothetical protein
MRATPLTWRLGALPRDAADPLAESINITISCPAAHGDVMNERGIPAGEKPRADPEIISPDRGERQSRSNAAGIRVFLDGDGVRHIYVARLGPVGMVVLALMVGVLFAITLVLVLGVFLIWIPLVGLLVAAAIISGLLRAYFRQPR